MNSKLLFKTVALSAAVGFSEVRAASKGDIWDLSEPKEITVDTAEGVLKFTYWTFVNTEFTVPKAYIKGRFEIEDKRSAAWSDTNMDVLRICMHMGSKYGYETKREALKWEIHPDADHGYLWKPVVYSPDYKQFDQVTTALNKDTVELFCGFPHYLEYANNLQDLGNNGIIVGKNTYNAAEKKASVEWTREFDVKAPDTITLMSNQDFRIWLQWGTYKQTDDPTDAGP